MLHARDRLDPARSPDEALAHLLLASFDSLPTDVSRLAQASALQAAVRRWPDDLDLAWFAVRACGSKLRCDRDAAIERLVEIDPDNSAAWLEAMGHAKDRGDEVAYEAALAHAAQAKFHDSRLGSVFVAIQPVLARLPPTSSCRARDERWLRQELGRPPTADDWADIEAHALELATALPGYRTLEGCKERGGALDPVRRRHCIALLSRIVDGDTLLEQGIGFAYLIPLQTDAAESARLRERYRHLQWLYPTIDRPARIDGFIRRMWTEGEVAVLQAEAERLGRWPPPANWLPEQERARSLILTGRATSP